MMKDKRYLTPAELLSTAEQHIFCARHLLVDNGEILVRGHGRSDTLTAVSSLIYTAFELSLKALLMHTHVANNQYKNLIELVDLTAGTGLSPQEQQALKKLARQQAFRKGIDYELWDDRESLLIFCLDMIALYGHLQELLPIELHPDYSV